MQIPLSHPWFLRHLLIICFHIDCSMGKFKSWIQGSQSSSSRNASPEEKKANRRSISGFALRPKKDEESTEDGEQLRAPALEAQLGDSRIIELAKMISSESESLDKYLKTQGLPQPSFDSLAASDFPKLPENVQRSRQQIMHAADELANLVRGPRESVRWGVWGVCYATSMATVQAQLTSASVSRHIESPNNQQLWNR